MFKHFEPIEQVFVDREQHLDWMTRALQRCKEKSVVLHLHGIGGIGKSSLIEHWKSSTDNVILLDFERTTDFFDCLDILAREIVLIGVAPRRFDIL